MEFTKEDNCDTCKHGYFNDFDFSGYHNMCGAGHCYLCAQNYGSCDDYEKGDVPEERRRDL